MFDNFLKLRRFLNFPGPGIGRPPGTVCPEWDERVPGFFKNRPLIAVHIEELNLIFIEDLHKRFHLLLTVC